MTDTAGRGGGRMRSDRREFLQFIKALGVGALGQSTLVGLDATLAKVNAQVVPGEVVPPLNAWIPNWPDQVEIWRQLAETWRTLGLTIKVQQGATAVWQSQIVGQHIMPNLVSMSWGGTPDRIDPDYFLTSILHSKRAIKGERNYGHYRNEEYDRVVDAQREEMDETARHALVGRAQAIAAKDDPVIVLFFRDYIQAYNSDRWEGVVPVFGSGIGMPYIPWSYLKMKSRTRRNVLRVTSLYDINTLNPFNALGVMDQSMIRWIYPTLVFRGPEAELVPWVAEAWKVVDATTVEITLRKGMTWHDGKPLTVQDVKFTFDFVKANRFPGLAVVREAIASTDIIDQDRVRFKLTRPFAPFLANVLGFAFVVPEHIWRDVKEPENYANEACIGAGPFKLKEWKRAEYIQLEANKSFFVPPNIDQVYNLVVPSLENQLGMLEQGESDMLGWYIDPRQAERLAKNKSLKVVSTPTHGFHEIRFNMEMAPTNHPTLRKALQHATDRVGLLKSVFGGAGTIANNSLITPAFKAWNNPDIPVPAFDLALARKILADGGFTWDGEGRLRYPMR